MYVPVHDGSLCIAPGTGSPILLDAAEAAPFLEHPDCYSAWLGTGEEGKLATVADRPGFHLLELSHLETPPPLGEGSVWAPLRGSEGAILGRESVLLDDDDHIALLSTARGLALWHNSVRFCSQCGGRTQPCRHGRNRCCTQCTARFRPRLDPSVIVLVTRGDYCLLGRQKQWAEGRWSTLAGFVEFGETLEECVLREMEEEAGVRCERSSLQYVATQPWLFPRSFMVGYIVETADETLKVAADELGGARWFERSYLREQLALQGDSDAPSEPGAFHVPSRVSLARTIIEAWLNSGARGRDSMQ
jgi:NAD+ diphosphatase